MVCTVNYTLINPLILQVGLFICFEISVIPSGEIINFSLIGAYKVTV